MTMNMSCTIFVAAYESRNADSAVVCYSKVAGVCLFTVCVRRFSLSTRAMGIQGLSKVLGDYAPSALKESEIKNYFGEF